MTDSFRLNLTLDSRPPAADATERLVLAPVRAAARAALTASPAFGRVSRLRQELAAATRRLDVAHAELEALAAERKAAELKAAPGLAKALTDLDGRRAELVRDRDQAAAEASAVRPVVEAAEREVRREVEAAAGQAAASVRKQLGERWETLVREVAGAERERLGELADVYLATFRAGEFNPGTLEQSAARAVGF